MALLPYYFYDIMAVMPDGRRRWFDEFSDESPEIWKPHEDINYLRRRSSRNEAYSKWIASKFGIDAEGNPTPYLKSKQMKWQVIRVHNLEDPENGGTGNLWHDHYRDAVFRVFVQPETFYYTPAGQHIQWYLLSPEDSYLVNRFEIEKKGASLPPRQYNGRERWLSADKRLRTARLIPVSNCQHMRRETSGGILPPGL